MTLQAVTLVMTVWILINVLFVAVRMVQLTK
jgi:hypothetical protein